MSKELSNIKEVKSRGADIVLFIKEALSGDLDTEYQVIKLPDMQDEFIGFTCIGCITAFSILRVIR